MPCGTCRVKSMPGSAPAPLCQIRHGYRAEWNGLALSVESESTDWTLRVQDFTTQILYTARRYAVRAAQEVGAEFALSRVSGGASQITPDRLAKELNWQEYW